MIEDDADVGRAPICPYCGVTSLAAETWDDSVFVCENADCEAFGDSVRPAGDGDGPLLSRGDIVVSDDGRMVGLVLVVADCGFDRPCWELHVDQLVDGAPEGVGIWEPSHVQVANSGANRALLESFDIRLA